MVDRKEVVGLGLNFEKDGGNGDGANARLVDIGNTTPNYDSKFTLKVFYRSCLTIFLNFSCCIIC